MRNDDLGRNGLFFAWTQSAIMSVFPSRLRPSTAPLKVTYGIPHSPRRERERTTFPVALSIAASFVARDPWSVTKRYFWAGAVIPAGPWRRPGDGPEALAAAASTNAGMSASRSIMPLLHRRR